MLERPSWIKQRISVKNFQDTRIFLSKNGINTVCEAAICPNMGECFSRGVATFMILGNTCTRNCRFCAIKKGNPEPVNKNETKKIANAVKKFGLKHVVITSVTRDDLEDGGASQFIDVVKEIRKKNQRTTIEVLIPDFKGNTGALNKIIEIKPEVIGHNLETIPRLYKKIRHGASYKRSLFILKTIKKRCPEISTKSSIMLGMGEKREEVIKVMNDLVKIKCDILCIGQYLSPSKKHFPVKEYITPKKFSFFKKRGEEKGLKYVMAGPFVRSSFLADKCLKSVRNIVSKTNT